MNEPNEFSADPCAAAGIPGDSLSRLDIAAAGRTDANLLFTGAPLQAEAIARKMHDASGWDRSHFMVVDCTQSQELFEPILSRQLTHLRRNGTIFLREVNALNPVAQQWMVEWLDQLRMSWPQGGRCRLIASTSEPLLRRINDGTFDDRLFYRLNVIHLVLHPRQFRG